MSEANEAPQIEHDSDICFSVGMWTGTALGFVFGVVTTLAWTRGWL